MSSWEAGEAERLAEELRERRRRRVERAVRAAVLLPLRIEDGRPSLLLTRRTDRVATHKGQVAFPGGFAEAGDRDEVDTALREASEEIALPRESVRVLGLLDDLPTHDDAVAVTPVVGLVRGAPQLRPQASEVARIFSIPLADLAVRERWRREMRTRAGARLPVFFFEHEGETLWGLSAYFAMQLLELLPPGAPYALPWSPRREGDRG